MLKVYFSRFLVLALLCLPAVAAADIDRQAVVSRNNPHVTAFDSLSALSVGNGGFAVTVDATGLQTFPKAYRGGVPLGTMSDWGWHSFPNVQQYGPDEALRSYDFGRGRAEPYADQFKEPGRQHDAANWLRANPHRLHLGAVGLLIPAADMAEIRDVSQTLDLWRGMITSRFCYQGKHYCVQTVCHPVRDLVATRVRVEKPAGGGASREGIVMRFAYPSGQHTDDGCVWDEDDSRTSGLHRVEVVEHGASGELLRHTIDSTAYEIYIRWDGSLASAGVGTAVGGNTREYVFGGTEFSFCWEFRPEGGGEREKVKDELGFDDVAAAAADHWRTYWTQGGIVDFSACTDPRAAELERRVVLSQYLMAIQDAGDTPPQETGLTYNSWFGKFHLEMILWHQAQFALWGHPDMLARSLGWYRQAAPMARQIARRQGFRGLRWMKMTDPSAAEAPSGVGSFLIWQQPHLIFLAELLQRSAASEEQKASWERMFAPLVEQTAEFMADFVTYDSLNSRYTLRGCIAAQETLPAATTVNPPFELSYWHCALQMAQQWRERRGERREPLWDDIVSRLSPLAHRDSLYLAAESESDTYKKLRLYSDHPSVLGAYGLLPLSSGQVNPGVMANTLAWVWDNWNWDKTWGWDFPMVAMCAARLGDGQRAVDALLREERTNTYLVSGHNYQDGRLRLYLPGNGGLLMAVAMMCAGWDGCNTPNPGFPKNNQWNVKWEGLMPMP